MKKEIYLFLYNLARFIQRKVMKTIRPKDSYYLAPIRELEPISGVYGFDRGNPIDRYYIESFLEANKDLVKGKCLEVTDTKYIKKYGGDKVTHADALDINRNNILATIYGDMKNLDMIPDETYDTLIITQTFGMIDDYGKAIQECHRILKKGGYILSTMSSMGQVNAFEHHFWRWTKDAAQYAFDKYFPYSELEIKSYGNILAGQCFWVGLSLEEMKKEELDFNDPRYPVIVSIKARK